MTLQFPIPQFVGQAVAYGGQVWIWDGIAWAIDDVASRLDLATVPAYEGQFVYKITGAPANFVSLGTPDLFGATFTLSSTPPFEGVKAYVNGSLLTPDDGSGTIGDYTVDRVTNRVVFQSPVAVNSEVIIGVLTPSDNLAPGRVDVVPIKDLGIDWAAIPPTGGMVDGVRTQFTLYWDRPGVGQQAAVISANEALAVVQNGRRLQPGIDYTVTGSTLTMTVAPPAGQPFWALWYRPGGASGGAGVEPPQPPQDAQSRYYGWVPGTGLSWADARGVAVTVADAAARAALRPDIDLVAGRLVHQADTQELWRWTGAAYVRYLDAGTFTARLGGRMQVLRSSTALARPVAGSGLPGELWVNTADRVIGTYDGSNDPFDLIGLDANGFVDPRFFSPGLRPYGSVAPGAVVISDWNNAHLSGTTAVRAPAGTPNRPPGADLAYAGTYISMGDANTGVLTAASPTGDTVFVRPRSGGNWGAWIQVNSPGLDISSAMLRANNLSDVASKPTGRTNLEVMFNPRTVYAGDLNVLDETGLYPLGIGVTNGWTTDGTGSGGEATVGDAVQHVETGGGLAFQLGFNLRPAGPAARPLRVRFMTGPTTWTPWASILTADEVTAAITAAVSAFGLGGQTTDKDANAAGLVTEMFYATVNPPVAGSDWHVWMASRAAEGRSAQIAVENSAAAARTRLAWRNRGGAGTWGAWNEAQPIYAGTTAQRPTTGLTAGLRYFDTTLGRPVWRNAANTAWVDLLEQVPPGTTVGDTAPANPQPGQLWFRTLSPVGLFVWINDGDSSQWVQTQGGGSFSQSGEQAINPNGLSEVTFDPIPREATSFTVTFANTQPGSNVIMSFVGNAGSNTGWINHVMGAAYAAPTSQGPFAEIRFDSIGAGGMIGNYQFERQPSSTIDIWVFTGSHRRGTPNHVFNTGRAILDVPQTIPRFRSENGVFASNPIIVKWRT